MNYATQDPETLTDALPVTAAKPTSAEDVRVGSYVTVLRSACELPSFFWGADVGAFPPELPIRYQHIPCNSGTPLKVKAVCVPFVLVRDPNGNHLTLDLRRSEVATLSDDYAKLTWQNLRRGRYRGLRKLKRKKRAKK
ncbi:MAG: hypothetical protein R3C19_24040 [Planctomycetaceae bacterium]